ncbi:MAG TPA: hypothetical protein VLK58_28865 [Conexibacter sp.]|nr:hypothetical protein [Conexibacter sp.]
MAIGADAARGASAAVLRDGRDMRLAVAVATDANEQQPSLRFVERVDRDRQRWLRQLPDSPTQPRRIERGSDEGGRPAELVVDPDEQCAAVVVGEAGGALGEETGCGVVSSYTGDLAAASVARRGIELAVERLALDMVARRAGAQPGERIMRFDDAGIVDGQGNVIGPGKKLITPGTYQG